MHKILTVDPGMKTGWALWTNRTLPIVGEIQLNEKSYKLVQDKFQYLWIEFDILLRKHKPYIVYLESVQYYKGSQKSEIALLNGDLFKLAYLIGGYANICDDNHAHYKFVPFSEWGGQLTPEAVKAQVTHLTKKEYASQHIYDAVGMGLYVHGKL